MKEREKAKDSEFDIQTGQVLDGRFRVETQLGKGSFGQVRATLAGVDAELAAGAGTVHR